MHGNNLYKINHRYNQNNTPIITTNDRPSVKSYREQIETMLTRWRQLQKEKHPQCQPINFDEIMETDLARQLQQLEQEEEKQYNLLEQALDDDTILQQLKEYRQKKNSMNYDIKEEYVHIHQEKQTLQIQLTIIKENQMKISKIEHLLESYFFSKAHNRLIMINVFKQAKLVKMFYGEVGPTFIEIPISKNETTTVWVSDGVTVDYIKRRINEISGDYYVDLTSTMAITTTTESSSSSQLNIIQNECNSYPTTNVLFGFGAGIALIILLLLVNLIVMLSKKRSKYHNRMENISDKYSQQTFHSYSCPLSTDSIDLTMSYQNIPTPLKTTTSIDSDDNDEYLLKIYEHVTKIMPISFVFILFVCVLLGWIIYSLCYFIENNIEKSEILDAPAYIQFINKIENSKKHKLSLKKIYPKETLFIL
ncbi:unnamed protein product [Rotaria magnacalcarata]|uniref:Uncharacterized protein n=1 Tax=Rotaria magnacalcarata TaxID=392030 RepID=A0A815EB10_9BILA|nr:unnamed protein product [Rotaria magnacalcarata]CAF3988045.1 unnamed protein product [Rotaria magnacalcarata]